MVATLALVVAVPLQLAAAAGVDLSGGYDSTVVNQRTGEYGDGGIMRLGIDLQAGHQGDYVRQLLRTRGEYYYTGGEGRDIDQGDLVSLTRYALTWEPSEDWQLRGEASYSIGQSSYLLGRARSIDLNFQRGVYGEYNGALTVQRALGESWRLALTGGTLGRHAVENPEGLARQNMLTFYGGLEGSHDFSWRDVGMLGGRTEYFLIDGFLDWVARVTGYVGWRRSWSEDVATTLMLGVDSLQDQTNTENWQVGPYVNAGVTWHLPTQGLALGATFRYEYAVVAGIRCSVAISGGMQCPAANVVSGGTGRVLGTALQVVYRPERGDFIFTGDLAFDRGTTENITPRQNSMMTGPLETREVVNINASAIATVRYMVTPQFSIFGRYSFLYTDLDADGGVSAPGAITQINRHVLLAGVIFALGTGDGPVEPITPFDEVQALHGAASAAGAPQSNTTSSSGAAGEEDLTADPFALSAAPDPRATSTTGEQRGDPRRYHPRDPRSRPPRPRTATQPLTRPATRDPSAPPTPPTEPSAAPEAPPAAPEAPSGDNASDDSGHAAGESTP
ncbi:MAG: hypothetical protein R3A52_03230 [Polyangiales bacterium]